jgi:hypothetical protein
MIRNAPSVGVTTSPERPVVSTFLLVRTEPEMGPVRILDDRYRSKPVRPDRAGWSTGDRPVTGTDSISELNCSSRSVLGTNSSEAAELSITCQGISADVLVKLYV